MSVDKVTSEGDGGKWTPGPWRIKEGPRHAPDCCDLTICGDIFMLADIRGPNYAHCEANARLIAAAPAMARELAAATAWMIERQSDEYGPRANWPARERVEAQEAALALAQGAEP